MRSPWRFCPPCRGHSLSLVSLHDDDDEEEEEEEKSRIWMDMVDEHGNDNQVYMLRRRRRR